MEKEKSKNKGGRPIEWTEKRALELAEDIRTWCEAKPSNIFLIQYCREKGLRHQIISDLSKLFPKFSDIIKEIKEITKENIQLGICYNKINVTAGIFTLKCTYGMQEPAKKVDITTNGEAVNKLDFSTLSKQDILELLNKTNG